MIIDIGQKTSLCDRFVVMSAPSQVRVRTIVDSIDEALKRKGEPVRHKEGYRDALWVLLDCAGVVVHVFYEPMRKYYHLENLWGDAPRTYYEKGTHEF